MPQLIQHIDKIAREKQRDVLFLGINLHFSQEAADKAKPAPFVGNKAREWLTEENIPHRPCALPATEDLYFGPAEHIYIDVPMDESDPDYQKLLAHFENEDGTPRDSRCILFLHTLDEAMKNAHHDQPGFWDEWAEQI